MEGKSPQAGVLPHLLQQPADEVLGLQGHSLRHLVLSLHHPAQRPTNTLPVHLYTQEHMQFEAITEVL